MDLVSVLRYMGGCLLFLWYALVKPEPNGLASCGCVVYIMLAICCEGDNTQFACVEYAACK
jgi:hypothetical protein